ncbi:NADH dehydrogenase-like protein [Cladobotryum mycophilum]|uniref:NADH dehydrogenase-like protein n=1 Tax=Cladobotryum mycophilum TaxID=491253 RepID=A0ABR0SBS4_9HYPO
MQQRILVVGSGFAGMWSALSARRLISQSLKGSQEAVAKNIEVAVIAPDERLVPRPRLYESNPSTVDTINTAQRQVEMVDPFGTRSTVSYDRLVLAAGSRLVRPNIPGLADHAFSVDTIDEAVKLEGHLQGLASLPDSPARNTVIVCGAGFTGIELVAELPSRLRAILGADAKIQVVVVGSGADVGPDLGPGPRPTILKGLNDLGVQMKLGSPVSAIDAGSVTTASGERIEALTAIWTAGVQATPLAKQIPGDRDNFGRLRVDNDLRVTSTPDVFATGDAAVAATDDQGNFTMMSCQHAQPLGRNAGHNAAADLLHLPAIPYSQPSYGTCLDLGPDNAVVTNGWDREVMYTGQKAKEIKKYINTTLIYPPPANAAEAFAAADPLVEPATV